MPYFMEEKSRASIDASLQSETQLIRDRVGTSPEQSCLQEDAVDKGISCGYWKSFRALEIFKSL